jgi:phospholipid/cholesterol/gamma-HCH transport system permease protein
MVVLSGRWTIGVHKPPSEEILRYLDPSSEVQRLTFNTEGLKDWDSTLLTFLMELMDGCSPLALEVDRSGLPQGVQKLLVLATAVPEKKEARYARTRQFFLTRVGEETLRFLDGLSEMLGFVGESFLAFLRLLRGKSRFRRRDFFIILQDCGAHALPIVSLISLLVGLIFAFVGAVQLVMFGAQIYVASLVAIAMVRVMGAVMVGIVMAGRTGAAFAAHLGTMQVNEEIDALNTLGISPIEFLVLPRMLALALMMPLLCVYADLVGILGGFIVGVGMLDLNVIEYYQQTKASVSLTDFWIGLFHSFVFGLLVALAGCLRGMQCGRSAAAVGHATTSAVVTGIVSIIVATALITVICNVLGI